MAMLAPLPLGLILTVVRGQARLVYGLAASLMGTAAFASGSRSGVISLSAGVVFVAILHRRSRADASWPVRRRKINPFVVVASATIACVLWIGPARTVERFAEAVDALVRTGAPDVRRATIWRETLGMIRDYPILGAGLGSYETIQPAYASTPSLFTVDYAHNDYLQVLAEGGAIAGILALCFLVVTFSAVYRGLRSRDPLFAGLSLAAGAGILAVAVQSVSDTDLQIPSNAVLFLTLSAIVSNIGERRQTQDFGPLLPLSKRFRVFEVNR
jgi:O-antigen ligase